MLIRRPGKSSQTDRQSLLQKWLPNVFLSVSVVCKYSWAPLYESLIPGLTVSWAPGIRITFKQCQGYILNWVVHLTEDFAKDQIVLSNEGTPMFYIFDYSRDWQIGTIDWVKQPSRSVCHNYSTTVDICNVGVSQCSLQY